MLRLVFWYKFTDVSEVLTASIIRAMSNGALTHRPDDEGSKNL
jgi:hypothetical protein